MKRPDNDRELAEWQNGQERPPADGPVSVDAVDVPLDKFWRVIGWPGSEESGAFMDDLQKRAPKESTTGTLAAALAKAQGQIKGAVKDAMNPAFRSKYADLASVWEACRKPLTDNGLSIIQFTQIDTSGPILITRLLHTSGESAEGITPLLMGKQDMQALGSAITYARRYGLAAMVGVAPEDDDGNAAVEAAPVATAKPVPEGYEDWVTGLTSAAENGVDALRAAWTASKPAYRTHAGPAFLDRLKAKAKAAGERAGVTVYDCAQKSAEWHALRAGRLTASCARDMLATIKAGEAAARRDLKVRLVVERLTGRPQEDGYVNGDMLRGVELEPLALARYEAESGELVSSVGFIAHDELLAGGSPDGVVGDYAGLVECKAPRPANHLRYLRENGVPKEHEAQCRHLLWLTGAAWIDFVSYCPPFPEHLQYVVRRLTRDDAFLAGYETTVRAFLEEVDRELAALEGWSRAEGAA